MGRPGVAGGPNYRLTAEHPDETADGIADTSTTYAYDAGNNRTLKEGVTAAGIVRVVDFAYDLDGDRQPQ